MEAPAGKTATVKVNAGAPVASTSSAQVGPGTAGSPTDVTITLRDAVGQSGDRCGREDRGHRERREQRERPRGETGGGAYVFRYTPLVAGTDLVRVRVGGADVPGSPFSSAVSPGPADAGHTTADRAGELRLLHRTFTVTVRDAQGNLRRPWRGRGGHHRRGRSRSVVTDNGNGIYSADIRSAAQFGTLYRDHHGQRGGDKWKSVHDVQGVLAAVDPVAGRDAILPPPALVVKLVDTLS